MHWSLLEAVTFKYDLIQMKLLLLIAQNNNIVQQNYKWIT